MVNKKLSIFWSKGFIIGLITLIINDHFLKNEYPNWITGKLSDIAGLFIFPIFFSAISPKHKIGFYWITSIGFIWWKSPFADGFIEMFNFLDIFTIHRVIDWTDLLTLAILPFSYQYFTNYTAATLKLNPLPILLISSLSFIATSRARNEITMNTTYSFHYSLDTLQKRLFFHPNIYNGFRKEWLFRDSMEQINQLYRSSDSIKRKDYLYNTYLDHLSHINILDSICKDGLNAEMELGGGKKLSSIHLTSMFHYCHDQKERIDPLLKKIFEEKIIKPLNK